MQLAPSRRDNIGTTKTATSTTLVEGRTSSSIDLTDEYLASVHTPYPDVLDLNRMDPSIALGFYCRDRKDFLNLQEALTNPNHRMRNHQSSSSTATGAGGSQLLVSFVDKVPNYMSSTLVNDMMQNDDDLDCCFDGGFDDPGEDELSDEDDYVLL